MLDFYPRKRPQLILDATVNAGSVLGRSSKRDVIGLDINSKFGPDVSGGQPLPSFQGPLLRRCDLRPAPYPQPGAQSVEGLQYAFRAGAQVVCPEWLQLHAPLPSVCPRGVSRPQTGGAASLQDRGLYSQPSLPMGASSSSVRAAIEVGFCACDCIIKFRKGPIVDPKWKTAHHARRQHCYWLVFRKSTKMRVSQRMPTAWCRQRPKSLVARVRLDRISSRSKNSVVVGDCCLANTMSTLALTIVRWRQMVEGRTTRPSG